MASTKTTKPRAKTTKAAPAEAPPAPRLVVKKRELIEKVTAETGLKRRDVKAATDAVLAALGETLARGEALAVEPLGKLRVARVVDGPAHQTLTVKLRQKRPGLADAAE